ncbi:MAG: pyruvate/2-oxoglutarate dehydrogenase complex dihydrolipoamide acyltransferase (E2) component, partial [Arenicella sp.]
MIKYLELTAPELNDFRQVKIISIEVAEGDTVEIGDTLFRVKNGDNEIDLPSTRAGKICELIVLVGENISVMTPLLLLETEVAGSTATPFINAIQESVSSKEVVIDKPVKKTKTKKTKTKKKKTRSSKSVQTESIPAASAQPELSQAEINAQQQSLDLAGKQEKKAKLRLSQTTNDTPSDDIKRSTVQGPDKQLISNTSEPIITKAESNMSNNTQTTKVTVPDIGGDNAKVIELHIKVGDAVSVDDSLITLESDKASMDVPSTAAGTVASISAQIDQEMGEGDLILELEASSDQAAQA